MILEKSLGLTSIPKIDETGEKYLQVAVGNKISSANLSLLDIARGWRFQSFTYNWSTQLYDYIFVNKNYK